MSVYSINETAFSSKPYLPINNQDNKKDLGTFYSKNIPAGCAQVSKYGGNDTPNSDQPEVTHSVAEIGNKISLLKNVAVNDQKIDGEFEKEEVGVWFYANFYRGAIPTSVIDRLIDLDVNTIYFAGTTTEDWQDPEKFRSYINFVCYAYSQGLDVYAVTLEDPSFVFAKEDQIKSEFSEFIEATKEFFNTFMTDVEPHTLHLSDPLVYVPQYIRMSLMLEETANHYNVSFIDTVPYWYHFVIKNIGISSGIDILGGNKVNFMYYSYTFNQSANTFKQLLAEVQKPFTISIKTTPGFGDPYLNEMELTKTISYLQNNSISYGIFESQYLLRNFGQ